MIKGIVQKNSPIISINVEGILGALNLIAIVDTGFTGSLKLSPQIADTLGLEVTHTEEVELGNHQSVYVPAGLAVVSLEKVQESVPVLLAQGISMIGIGLLRQFGYNLYVDLQEDMLTLEK